MLTDRDGLDDVAVSNAVPVLVDDAVRRVNAIDLRPLLVGSSYDVRSE